MFTINEYVFAAT